jgi:Contact-dependent growth inhibition CdiA C-terminal domain
MDGQPDRTVPSRQPDPYAKPRGRAAKPSSNSKPDEVRGLTRENESAVTLARKGYDIEQKPAPVNSRRPDFKIEGRYFDNYAPTTSRARNIWSEIQRQSS